MSSALGQGSKTRGIPVQVMPREVQTKKLNPVPGVLGARLGSPFHNEAPMCGLYLLPEVQAVLAVQWKWLAERLWRKQANPKRESAS
jgi:hypothetical protein